MIALFLATGFEETEAVATIDVIRRAGLQLQVVSVTDSLAVIGANKITIQADCMFDDLTNKNELEMLVLPGGMPGTLNLKAHKELAELIKLSAKNGKKIAAICAAPTILGNLGLLKDKSAVCYPGFESELNAKYISDDPVLVDDNIITSRGVGTVFCFGIAIVTELLGTEKADEISKSILW